MKSLKLIISVSVLAVAGSACSTRPISHMFSSQPSFHVRPYRMATLPNGMHIYFVKDDSLPRVALTAIVKTGLRDETAELNGVNSLTSALLDQGTRTRTSEQLSDAFNTLGTEFTAQPGIDGTILSADALSTDAKELLGLYADVIMNPQFSEKETERAKAQYVASLKRRVDNASHFASQEFNEYLYAGHPYGRNPSGSLKSIAAVKRTDVIRNYLSFYRPNNTMLSVAGRFDDAFEKKVEETFAAWTSRPIKQQEVAAPPAIPQLAMRLVTHPKLQQTQIRFGRIAIERSNKDYLALALGVHAFGGGFGARLMQKVRDDLGLTYSVSADLDGRKLTGDFGISTFTRNEMAGKAIEEILKLYDAFVKDGITEQELNTAKADVLGQYPRSLELASNVGQHLMLAELQGLPSTELVDYPAKIESLSLTQVNEAIRKHLGEGSLKILVYGSEKIVGPQVQAWKPEVVRK